MKIENLKCRVRVKSGDDRSNDRAQPATPSLQFAQPQPLAPQPRIDAADHLSDGEQDVGVAASKADPRKVANRVYELMKKEVADGRMRGGPGRKR